MRRPSKHSAWLVALVALPTGCAAAEGGPAPVLAGPLEPSLVCGEQLETAVMVSGAGFATAPIRSADGTRLLRLPSLSLKHSQDLRGNVVAPAAVVHLHGPTPTDPFAPVRWLDAARVEFRVDETLGLEPGVHTLALTNPDGQGDSRQQALVVVGPPTAATLEPAVHCTGPGAAVLTIQGEGFLDVAGDSPTLVLRSATGDRSFTPSSMAGCRPLPPPADGVLSCSGLTASVPAAGLDPGSHAVTVHNPAPAPCLSREVLTLTVVETPQLAPLGPATLCTRGGRIRLGGVGFRPDLVVRVGELRARRVISPQPEMVEATFGPGLSPGTYALHLETPEGCAVAHPEAVRVVRDPRIVRVDPPIVHADVLVSIALSVAGLEATTTPTAVSLHPSGGGAPLEVPFTDGTAATSVEVSLPRDLPVGAYDVVLHTEPCPSVLPSGLLVVDDLTLTVLAVAPSRAPSTTVTEVIIDTAGSPHAPELPPSARAYLTTSPRDGDAKAVRLEILGLERNQLRATVPRGLTPGSYGLLIVSGDNLGHLPDAFAVVDP